MGYDFDMLANGIEQIRANRQALEEALAKEEEKEQQYIQFLRDAAQEFIRNGGELEHVSEVFATLGIPLVEVTGDGGSD